MVEIEKVENSIYLIRGFRVMLDNELAVLYGIQTFYLNQQVRRNIKRFPDDFMFQLTTEEAKRLRLQNAISKKGRGGRRYLHYAFTEQGVAMLSSVLIIPKAVKVNIQIMRTFVKLRQLMASNTELARKIEELEKRYDGQFAVVFDAIRQLVAPSVPPKRKIGYTADHQANRVQKKTP